MINYKQCSFLISEDLKRLSKNTGILNKLLFQYKSPSFKMTYWFRIGSFLSSKKNPLFFFLLIMVKYVHRKNEYKTGIQIPLGTKIGAGLLFPHFSGIVINSQSIVGDYCTIFHGVTLGSIRGKGGGAPIIGNKVVIATGAKILGNIQIGDNVFIGANTVILKDIPNNAVVVGNPAKIINMDGIEKTKYYL